MRTFIILFALIWVISVAGFLLWRNPDGLLAMSPGEWGEFLSGLFGPPGFVAIVGTLFQQGGDLRRQREQFEKQLATLETQSSAQMKAAEATQAFAKASLDHSLAARQQADSTTKQTELAIERLQIERVRNQANGLALLAVRYADRLILKIADGASGIALIGTKDMLRDDFGIGAEAVLETVRTCLKANLELFAVESQNPLADRSTRQSFESLVNNLIQRVGDTQSALEQAAPLPEIIQLRTDLALVTTRERLQRIKDLLLAPPSPKPIGAGKK
jgi:hypothetical protein